MKELLVPAKSNSIFPAAFLAATSALLLVGFLLGSCQKDVSVAEPDFEPQALTTITTTCFRTIAKVDACTGGEWIYFSGMIDNRVSTNANSNGGTVVTRSFSVREMSGKGISAGATLPNMACSTAFSGTYTGTLTGTQYDVLGGAEMFAIHFDPGGSATLAGSNTFIHRGTLVFENTSTGEKVIAKHVIRKVNGVIQVDTWECN